mmetsp:Transcript_20999/g.56220  ORF Transcript_20999/g.56220 Transcript_20999/m.56220 type:complete len:208 (+) Transcript_20999:410-1033(+)
MDAGCDHQRRSDVCRRLPLQARDRRQARALEGLGGESPPQPRDRMERWRVEVHLLRRLLLAGPRLLLVRLPLPRRPARRHLHGGEHRRAGLLCVRPRRRGSRLVRPAHRRGVEANPAQDGQLGRLVRRQLVRRSDGHGRTLLAHVAGGLARWPANEAPRGARGPGARESVDQGLLLLLVVPLLHGRAGGQAGGRDHRCAYQVLLPIG